MSLASDTGMMPPPPMVFSEHTIEAGQLRHAYLEGGPSDGPVIMLVHGWPDSARGWLPVARTLVGQGYRVIVPFLRGSGDSVFLRADTMRSGQLGALVDDIVQLAGALDIKRCALVGHDWGARIAYAIALRNLLPLTHCIALSAGWGGNAPNQPLSYAQVRDFWYQWFLATSRGEAALRDDTEAFLYAIWTSWSPGWPPAASEFQDTLADLRTPDWASVTLHYYRSRWGFIATQPEYQAFEQALAASDGIHVPSLVLHGATDQCNAVVTTERQEALFRHGYRRVVINECGHFPQREQPDVVASEIINHLRQFPVT